MLRIATTARGPPFVITVDGDAVTAYPGETVAAAMLADDRSGFRHDRAGRARGLWCNMGTCCECLVTLDGRAVRACLVDAAPHQRIDTAMCRD